MAHIHQIHKMGVHATVYNGYRTEYTYDILHKATSTDLHPSAINKYIIAYHLVSNISLISSDL